MKKARWKNPEVIDWLDHSLITGGWTLQSELSQRMFTCRSIGWVINETKKKLQIVPHFGIIDDADMQTEGVMTIIKSTITRRKTLNLK